MCVHVMKQKKCHYIGNCSFAHSQEERDVWTYMKNNSCKNTCHVSALFETIITLTLLPLLSYLLSLPLSFLPPPLFSTLFANSQ